MLSPRGRLSSRVLRCSSGSQLRIGFFPKERLFSSHQSHLVTSYINSYVAFYRVVEIIVDFLPENPHVYTKASSAHFRLPRRASNQDALRQGRGDAPASESKPALSTECWGSYGKTTRDNDGGKRLFPVVAQDDHFLAQTWQST